MGAFNQADLFTQSSHNAMPKWEAEFDHMRPRIMASFADPEKAGFFYTDGNYSPKIVVQYDGGEIGWGPWMQIDRETGEYYDVRDPRHSQRGRSNVRYHRDSDGVARIGPYTRVMGPAAQLQLQKLADMGYEFQYRGDVGSMKGVGVFDVVKTTKRDPNNNRPLHITNPAGGGLV